MKRFIRFLLIMIVLLASIPFTGCKPQLARFGNRSSCAGFDYTSLASETDSEALWFPVWGSPVEYAFHDNGTFLVLDTSGVLHLVNELDGSLEQSVDYSVAYRSIGDLALSGDQSAFSLAYSPGGVAKLPTSKVFELVGGALPNPDHATFLERFAAQAWHPTSPLLAGAYFPNDEVDATNQVAVFNAAGQGSEPEAIFEIGDSAISQVPGWSGDGQIIAVLQWRETGLIPVYVNTETGQSEVSLISSEQRNCVAEAGWLPSSHAIVFSARNETTEGYDLFKELVVGHDRDNDLLVNLTDTPRADEFGASWSPDGTQLVYSKAYLDTDGTPRQELYLQGLSQPLLKSARLTDTVDEMEANPVWVSESEVAYLSWAPSDSAWFLKTLSLTEPDREPESVMEIPESWYRGP